MVLPETWNNFPGQFVVVVREPPSSNLIFREPQLLCAFNTFVRRLHALLSAGKDVSAGWKTRADKRQRDCVLHVMHVTHVAGRNKLRIILSLTKMAEPMSGKDAPN